MNEMKGTTTELPLLKNSTAFRGKAYKQDELLILFVSEDAMWDVPGAIQRKAGISNFGPNER